MNQIDTELLQKYQEHRAMRAYHPEVVEHWPELEAHRARAFDTAPPESLSAEDRELLEELLQMLQGAAEKPEEEQSFDVRRHCRETLDRGGRVFPHASDVQAALKRGQGMFERAKDGRPLSDLEWMQQSAAASCGFAGATQRAMDGAGGPRVPPPTRLSQSLRQRRGNQNLQAAYDRIRNGAARK